jgi:hypothetical protein
LGQQAGYYITTGSKNTIIGRYNGNQNGLDIRTSSNNIVLSDGDGNVRAHCDSSGTWTGVGASTTFGAVGTYVYGMVKQTTALQNTTYSGSAVWLAGNGGGDGDADYFGSGSSFGGTWGPSTSVLSGTWRYMSRQAGTNNSSDRTFGLFVRIS